MLRESKPALSSTLQGLDSGKRMHSVVEGFALNYSTHHSGDLTLFLAQTNTSLTIHFPYSRLHFPIQYCPPAIELHGAEAGPS